MFISRTSNDIPSPSAKSAKPPKSARDSNFTIPGAFVTLNFSIFNFEEEDFFSITDENKRFPPLNPLKKLYSVNNGLVKSGIFPGIFYYLF